MYFKLLIESHVWNKDTNSLFDYESKDYFKSTLVVKKNGYLMRNDKNLTFHENEKPSHSTKLYLASIKKNIDNYQLNFELDGTNKNMLRLNEEKVFVVLRYTYFKDNVGLKIKQGDVVKFGKIMFKISAMSVKDNSNYDRIKSVLTKNTGAEGYNNKFNISSYYHQNENNQNNVGNIQENENNKIILNANTAISALNYKEQFSEFKEVKEKKRSNRKKTGILCRICLFEDNDSTNPLINPCKCAGTMKYIHLFCLREWLKSKLVKKMSNYLTIYSFKDFECEICKVPIPDKIKIKNDKYSLIDMDKLDNSNHLILESIPKDRTETKHIYIINFKEKNRITIGRSNDSDVKMSDISVSRFHAGIKILNGFYYLEDYTSKFGTLFQLQNDIELLPNRMIALQIGKTLTKFIMEKTLRGMLNCCYKFPITNIHDYNGMLSQKSNLHFENIYNCDNASESEVTENLSIKEEKDENQTLDKGEAEITEVKNNECLQIMSVVNDKKTDVFKEDKTEKLRFSIKSERESELYVNRESLLSNNYFKSEKDNSIIKENKDHESRREVIIENPNEDNSMNEEIEFKKYGENEKYLYEQIKELQSLNYLLTQNLHNPPKNDNMIENVEMKEGRLCVRSYNTLKDKSDKNLFKELSKRNNDKGRKSFEYKLGIVLDEELEKGINVVYKIIPQKDVNNKETNNDI